MCQQLCRPAASFAASTEGWQAEGRERVVSLCSAKCVFICTAWSLPGKKLFLDVICVSLTRLQGNMESLSFVLVWKESVLCNSEMSVTIF